LFVRHSLGNRKKIEIKVELFHCISVRITSQKGYFYGNFPKFFSDMQLLDSRLLSPYNPFIFYNLPIALRSICKA